MIQRQAPETHPLAFERTGGRVPRRLIGRREELEAACVAIEPGDANRCAVHRLLDRRAIRQGAERLAPGVGCDIVFPKPGAVGLALENRLAVAAEPDETLKAV